MILVTDIIEINRILTNKFGGVSGVREISALESAIARPFQTFDNSELYPTLIEKAASLIESILSNHQFIDGNKRTGYVAMRLFLISNGFDINANEDDKYNFVIDIAKGEMKFDEIVNWLSLNTIQNKT